MTRTATSNLADAYLAAAAERRTPKANTSRRWSCRRPTPRRAPSRLPSAPGSAKGRLADEHTVNTWVPTHLTDAQKADATQYDPGFLVQFTQNTTAHKKGTRLIVGDGLPPKPSASRRWKSKSTRRRVVPSSCSLAPRRTFNARN